MGWLQRIMRSGAAQRRTFAEVQQDLFLDEGERDEKRWAFWPLLVLSTVIAAGGVIENSTATVVGAMIIAPLGTPIFGAGLAIAAGYRRRLFGALGFLVAGILVAITIGALLGRVIPARMPLDVNPQVTGRTSPALLDLIVALATGFAGAYGLIRRDISSVLPGVAIAISLVPPLAVVGITAGQGSYSLAFGALLLFLSNVVAILVASVIVFSAAGYRQEAIEHDPRLRKRAVWVVVAGLVALLIPLGFASYRVIEYDRWTGAVTDATERWLTGTAWKLESTQVSGSTIVVSISGSGPTDPIDELRRDIRRSVPRSVEVRLLEQTGADVGI